MPSRLCLEPGCPDPARHRGRCTRHAAQRERSREKPGRKVYMSKRWRITRRYYLGEHPICEECNRSMANVVHHRVDLADGGEPYAFSNLQALCPRCHNRETRRRQIEETVA